MSAQKSSRKSRRSYTSEGGFALIDIRLHSSKQLFDARDPAPFRDRDLDDDFVEYLEASADEIPQASLLKLRLHLEEFSSDFTGPFFQEVLSDFFQYKISIKRMQLRRFFETVRLFLFVGFLVLMGCLLTVRTLVPLIPWDALREILDEGILISGWVALWRPLELMLFDWWPLRRQIVLFERLRRVQVEIVGPAKV